VPSFTSSSEPRFTPRAIPPGRWLLAIASAGFFLLMFVAAMEWRLAIRGFSATVVDSDALWLEQRQKAGDLGNKALILVGASRIQLDLDLDVLHEQTNLVPVQLAVDGGAFTPVLDSLANDPRVTGTLLVGYQDDELNKADGPGRAAQLEAAWEQYTMHAKLPDFASTESVLTDALHYRLRSYADGARPLTSLTSRLLDGNATPQYLITLPDRSRLADYQRVAMPDFYYSRVIRNLGEEVPLRDGMSWNDVATLVQGRIELLNPVEKVAYDDHLRHIASMVKMIEQRGGKVIFVVMPRSGMVKEIDDKRFPRADFWNEFAARVGAESLNVEDYPDLSAFQCPDGSHLDYHDRARFTEILARTIVWDRAGGKSARGPLP